MQRQIRPARREEIPAIMAVIDAAKDIMRRSGNTGQWINGYPSAAVIENDIDRGYSYVVTDGAALVERFGGYYAVFIDGDGTLYYSDGFLENIGLELN